MKQSEVHALKGKWVCKLKIHHLPPPSKGMDDIALAKFVVPYPLGISMYWDKREMGERE
jgi:hypothetical protein